MLSEVKFIDIAFNPTSYKNTNKVEEIISNSLKVKCLPIYVGSNLATNKKVFDLAYKNKSYCYIGIHPNDITKEMNLNIEIACIKNLLDNDSEQRIIGIGECGLDTYRSPYNLDEQILVFKRLLDEFHLYNLPFFLHLRDSEEFPCVLKFIEILKTYKTAFNIKGVVHSFTSCESTLTSVLDLGFYIGINGISVKENITIINQIPIEKILLETDSPYCLIRKSWAGATYVKSVIKSKNNEPAFIYQVCEVIANIKNIDYEKVRSTTLQNTLSLFKRIKLSN